MTYRIITEYNNATDGAKPCNPGNPIIAVFEEFIVEGWIETYGYTYNEEAQTMRTEVNFVDQAKRNEFSTRISGMSTDLPATLISEGEVV